MRNKYIIGIDLGGTNLKIALLDLRYRIRYKQALSTQRFKRKEDLISGIVNSVFEIIRKNRLSRRDILGLGLGLPGPIDTQKGLVHFFPNISGWRKVNLGRILERKLKLAVFLDNDANLMSIAEHRLGGALGFKNCVCITLGTGVGGGIIIEGKLYRGTAYAAGEAGHIPINEKGPQCNCGGIACLEAYIGNKRILQKVKGCFNKDIPLEELSRLAKRGNKKAQLIWAEVGTRLGVALSGMVNLLNPDCIVIGGGVAGAGRVLFDRVRETILKRAMSIPARHVKIYKAKLGNDAGLIGAAILVKERVG